MANLSAFGGAQPITPGGEVEVAYVEQANNYTTTATTPGSAPNIFSTDLTIVADGVTPYTIEFFSPEYHVGPTAPAYAYLYLYQDGSLLYQGNAAAYADGTYNAFTNAYQKWRFVPTAGTHTYNVRATASLGTVYVSGAVANYHPNYLRACKIVQQNDGLKPFWTPPITASLPSNPDTGDQIIYKHGGTGNIGSHLPMIYDGTKWQPVGEAVLCRWNCGSATQVFSSTSATNVTTGDYNTRTFTPPWDGYYEISQKTGMWELNSGIGMYTNFSATDGSAHHQLHYIQDWNGPYQHHREGHGMPIAVYLYSAKTYRFTATLTYASGNTGTINFFGTAHVRALSR